jgi:nucleotide-binding universal stress UspA family protein
LAGLKIESKLMYKTILVHLYDERRAPAVLEAAAFVATRFESHVIGLYVMPSMRAAAGMSRAMLEASRKPFYERADRIKTTFERLTRGRSFVAEWRFIEPTDQSYLQIVIREARTADLIVSSQRDRDWEDTLLLEAPDALAVESGRPVLLIPNFGKFPEIGSRTVIAWNGRREAARATFDALPLLKIAREVRILWVNPDDDPSGFGDVPTTEIAVALGRHGVRCEVMRSTTAEIKVGDELLARLADYGSDLLVMGAYGHSRLRELILGGTTREILHHMTAPVLMSH